ncbi:MAG: CHAP domain-containing protein [Rhizomicrobium sp.]
MVGSFIRLAAVTAFSLTLAACSTFTGSSYEPVVNARGVPVDNLQCVPYARQRSGIQIYGDAWTWWDKADGKYAKSQEPRLGAVMVMAGYAGPKRAHLAVVSGMDDASKIEVDHANWLNDGAVFTDDPVRDISGNGDWSLVQVWNPRTNAWGTNRYAVLGFILPAPDGDAMAMN